MLSALESLPRELQWMIIDYAPESVFNLKQSSQSLRTRIDERARHSSFVKKVVLSSTDWREYQHQHRRPFLRVRMIVAKHHMQLFETRLLLSEPPMALSFISREQYENVDEVTYFVTLYTEYDVDYVNRCLGWRIDTTEIVDCKDERELSFVCKIIEEKKFAKLTFNIATISDYIVEFILNILKKHNVDELHLWIEHFNANRDPKSFLLDAASTARSMFLCHRKMNFIRRTQPCFPTMDDEDWISAILKMFSRRLDKLSIHKSIKGLLSHESLDIIREASRLPHLGKPIWFHSACNLAYAYDRSTYTDNEHLVEFNERSFTIKHITRANEEMKF